MQFIYHIKSGDEVIYIRDYDYNHIFRSRREKKNKNFIFSNMIDYKLYRYKLAELTKKEAIFNLESFVIKQPLYFRTHIIQSIISMSEFTRILPTLNELMVGKITLFYSDFSQRNEKINLNRLNKILINSSMQCGRLDILKIEVFNNLESVIKHYSNAIALDFGCDEINIWDKTDSFIIGPEGGFSKEERDILKNRSFSIKSDLIMRSSTASIFVASKRIN